MTAGNPVKMAMVDIDCRLPPWQQLEQVFRKLAAVLPRLLAIRNKVQTESCQPLHLSICHGHLKTHTPPPTAMLVLIVMSMFVSEFY